MEVAGPLGTPLGLAQRKRASEAKDPVACASENALYPVPVEQKPGLPMAHGLYAWEINRGFFRDDLIEHIRDGFFLVMLVRYHEIGKETARGAAALVAAFAERDQVPLLFAGVLLPYVAMYMGSVKKKPFPAFRTQAFLGAVNDGLVIFGIASDLILCYNGHGC